MKEIGGYIELDTYYLPMLHEGAIALNCGRNALAYLLRTKQVHKIWIPRFICDSVTDACDKEAVPYEFYSIGSDFKPKNDIKLEEDDWLYIINYYGQLSDYDIAEYKRKHCRIIVDNAQSYFQMPIDGVDTLYTCRKYFGVADGAFLYTDEKLNEKLPLDESYERMHFLLGRFERRASEFYNEYVMNNEIFKNEPIKQMSMLTSNLLHGIDYEKVKETREKNYSHLYNALKDINNLDLKETPGTFMYPLLINNGYMIRKTLQQKKIYLPVLWPSVLDWCNANDTEYHLAENIIPLPIDQRYCIEDMKYLVEEIQKCL